TPQQQLLLARPTSGLAGCCLIEVANCSAARAAYATPVHGPMPLCLRDRNAWLAGGLKSVLAFGLAGLRRTEQVSIVCGELESIIRRAFSPAGVLRSNSATPPASS